MSEDATNEARQRLRQTMSDLSESHYYAGWMMDTEFELWSAVMAGGDYRWGHDTVTPAQAAELRRMAEAAGGWWMWDDAEEEVFVPLREWLRIYDAYTAKRAGKAG